MKFNKTNLMKGLCGLLAVSGLSLAFTACQSDDDMMNSNGKEVFMKVSISKESLTDETRSVLTEVGGNLECVWSEGDQVLVTDTQGVKKGVLTVVKGQGGNAFAEFEGTLANVKEGDQVMNFFYLGTAERNPLQVSNPYVFDYSSQSGTIESLSEKDVFTSTQKVNVENGLAYTEDMGLSRKVSFAHFELIFPEGVAYNNETVSISGEGLCNALSLNLTNKSTSADGGITVAKKDFYITVIPGMINGLTFNVTIGNRSFEGTLGARLWAPSEFVRESAGVGVPVRMEETEPEPENPGDISNWGGPDCEVKYIDSGDLSKKYSDGGYVYNNYSQEFMAEGGWATPITYTSNGVTHGALHTSNRKMSGENMNVGASYYQWGRWMGFPENVYNILRLSFNGQALNYWTYDNDYFVPGESIRSTSCGYINTQYDAVPGGFFAQKYTNVWTGDGWDNAMAKKASHIYGAIQYIDNSSFTDYLNTNENCTWTDRTGNPCPKGWRIPTMEELKVLIPSGGSISGKKAEVKIVDGVKYAMRWQVTTATVGGQSYPCVRISSVRTEKTSVTFDDAVFADAPALDILAYGVLSNTGQIEYKGQRAYVWSQNSATSKSLSGYAGAALKVVFNGSSVTMNMAAFDRVYGATVIPFKDAKAVPTSITPWFPLTNY